MTTNTHTHIPMQPGRVLGNSVALVLLDVASKAAAVVSFPIVARTLGPVTYGKVSFAMAVAGAFALLAAPGFAALGTREIARYPDRSDRIVPEFMGMRIVFAVLSFAILCCAAPFIARGDSQVWLLIQLFGVGFVVTSFDLQWLFLGQSRMWPVATVAGFCQLAYVGVVILFIHRGAWVLPAAASASTGLAAAVLLSLARRQYRIAWPAISPRSWLHLVPGCLVLGLASSMTIIYDKGDAILLRYFRSATELGLYTASYRIMQIGLGFLPIMTGVFYPLFSASAKSKHERQYANWMGQSVVGLALPVACGGFLLAGPLTRLLLGPKYIGAEVLLRWLMPNIIAAAAASYYSVRLIPHGRERLYLLSVSTGGVANLVLNLVLIPRYGARAAAVTTIVSYAIVAALSFLFTRDLVTPPLIPLLVKPGIATAVMSGTLLTALSWKSSIPALVLVALGMFVYCGTYAMLMYMPSPREA